MKLAARLLKMEHKMRTSTEVNEENERIKHKYLHRLVEAKGRHVTTAGKVADTILRFERSTGFKSFRTFAADQAVKFKQTMLETISERTGKPLATATYVGALAVLKAFFLWLSGQPGFRSRIDTDDIEYLTPPMKDARIANARHEVAFPTIAQCKRAFECMPDKTPRNRRDKAFFALLMLTAARSSAALSLLLKHVDLVEKCIHQDAREVETKFSKTFRTDFFPVDPSYSAFFAAWVMELREVHLFGHNDPVFPRITEHFIEANRTHGSAPLKRALQTTDTNIRKVIKMAFSSQGMPAFGLHSFRKTNALLSNQYCRTLEEQKAWSQNLGHESVVTTVDDYMPVAPGRQRDILGRMRSRKAIDELD